MRPIYLLHLTATFLLSLVFSASIAQTISNQKGLNVIEFNLPYGKIKIYLPDDIRPGDMISGAIKTEPEGRTDKQKQKALDELLKRKLRVTDPNDPKKVAEALLNRYPNEAARINIESASLPFTLSVYNNDKPEQSIEIKKPEAETNDNSSSGCHLPTHALTGSPVPIKGTFDGDASNTKCSIDNKSVEILAESPRQTIINYPQEATGIHTLQVAENGQQKCESKVSGVDMSLSTGKLNLQKGEQTYVDVAITGLQNLPSNATLTVTNLTTGVVTMVGGENQILPIPPSNVSGEGTFNKRFNLQSIRTGSFSVNVNLNLPDATGSTTPSIGNWVACDVCGGTIMPKSRCDEFKKDVQPILNTISSIPDTPSHIPFTTTTVNVNNDNIVTSVNNNADIPVTGIAYSVQQLPAGTNNNSLHVDSIPGAATNYALQTCLLPTGVHQVTTTVFAGENYSYNQSRPVLITTKANPGSISNRTIDSLRNLISRYENIIRELQRQIEQDLQRYDANNARKREIERNYWEQMRSYYELQTIDATLDKVKENLGDTLWTLVDSLQRFRDRVGQLPDEDELKQKVRDLEAALEACRNQVADLQKEQKDAQQQLSNNEQKQSDLLREIVEAYRNAGFNGASFSERNSKTGDFSFKYGYIYRNGGNAEFVEGIPAQIYKKVSDLQKQIKDLNQQNRQLRDRLKKIPDEIKNMQKQCDELAAELAKANELKRKGINNIRRDEFLNMDIDELCRQVRSILQDLVDWSHRNKNKCGTDFESWADQFIRDCPKNKDALNAFWKNFESLLSNKKACEDNFKKRADDLKKQMDDIDKDNRAINDDLTKKNNDLSGAAFGLNDARRKEDQEIEKEMARKYKDEMEKKLARQRICAEWLNAQAQTEDEKLFIKSLVQIKEAIQTMGEKTKEAAGYFDKLTKEKARELTDEIRECIDKVLEPLEKFDEYKKKLDKWKGIKEDLEKLLKTPANDRERAEQFGLALKKIHEQLGDLVDKFPILKLFVDYFGFLIDSYNWAIEKSYESQETYFRKYFEQRLGINDCPQLIFEYMKRKNLDDVYRRAAQKVDWDKIVDPLLGTSERRRVAELELKKLVLKLLTDCCLRELMM